MKLKRSFAIGVFVLGTVGIGVLYWRQNTVWIEAGHVGLIYDASRGILDKVYEPQSVFVGWRQQLYQYPTKPQNAVYSQDASEGEVKAADGILITTSDNANTTFDISIVYRVKKENVRTVFNTFGPITIEEIQANHIRRAVRDGASSIGSQYTVFQLIGSKRQEASEKLAQELRDRLEKKGITIDQAMILRPYLTKETEQRVYSSINSYTQIGISQLESQIAQINSAAELVRADAERQARSITANKTQQKSLEMLNLELEADAIRKWNGHLSPIQPQPGQTLVVDGSGNGVTPVPRGR
ncbi:MAG: hypothetical protein JSS72_10850 [Armatimonadetes bacterium]|nr:hypothetical protein [Armatimonadota bacterium]